MLAERTQSIAFGAGVLSSLGGPAFGALVFSLNNVHEQVLKSNASPCHENIKWKETGRSFATGCAVENIAKGVYKAGELVIKMPNIIGTEVGSRATQFTSYGPLSAITANVAGTVLIKWFVFKMKITVVWTIIIIGELAGLYLIVVGFKKNLLAALHSR